MKRVLIVEDEVAIREFEAINLKRVGYETVEAVKKHLKYLIMILRALILHFWM